MTTMSFVFIFFIFIFPSYLPHLRSGIGSPKEGPTEQQTGFVAFADCLLAFNVIFAILGVLSAIDSLSIFAWIGRVRIQQSIPNKIDIFNFSEFYLVLLLSIDGTIFFPFI